MGLDETVLVEETESIDERADEANELEDTVGNAREHQGECQESTETKKTKRIRYIETFFHESTDKYLSGQTIVKIKEFRLMDQDNQIIVEDSF